jgi:phage baseplate assembly protein W
MTTTAAVYSDVDIELSQASDGDIQRDIDEDAVINSIRNIIWTFKGSRRMLPDFAANIQKLLFEPIDGNTASLIRSRLVENIYKWDDRVIINEIYIEPIYEQNMYKCLMIFKIKGFEHKGLRNINWVIRRD